MSEDLTIRTVTLMHQRTYFGTHPIRKSPYGRAWDWLHPEWQAFAAKSKTTTVTKDHVKRLEFGLKLMIRTSGWYEATDVPAANCSSVAIRALFAKFEQKLMKADVTNYGAIQISRLTRNFVLGSLRRRGAIAQAGSIRKLFRSQIPAHRSGGRKLISDMPHAGRPPLAAVSYSSHAELKKATAEILQGDLERILEASCDVLDRYDGALLALNELSSMNVSAAQIRKISLKSTEAAEAWPKVEMDIFLALVAQGKLVLPKREELVVKIYPTGLLKHFRSKLHETSNGTAVSHLLRLHIAPPAQVLLVCALIIQIHTHWNFISVLEISSDAAEIKDFPHRLQSVKRRTSDETPPVFIERSDERVIRALSVLTDRRHRLIAAGIMDESQKELWASSRSVMSQKGLWPVVGWSTELKAFIKKYDLPDFSLEQVRVQCLATIAIGDRGLSGVMQSAGHVSSSTSLGYVERLLLTRLRDAGALEFERRLENTVHYMMGKPNGKRMIAYPIGDGSSCRDPENPPTEVWLESGVCKAERCHDGEEGCPNRSIVINEDRMEEVVRTKVYYIANWKRLADENSVRFEKTHLPHMLFSLALYGVLKRGPYRHLMVNHESVE